MNGLVTTRVKIVKILFDLDIKNANFQTSFEVLNFSIVLLQGRKIPKKDQFHQAILLIHCLTILIYLQTQ